MNYKNTSKKSVRFGYLFLAVFAFSMSTLSGLGGLIAERQVEAAGTSFAFYWNSDDPAAKRNLEKELENEKDREGAYKRSTKILIKNGPGSKDSVLNYDLDTTNKYSKRTSTLLGDTSRGDDKHEYFWSKRFYCTVKSKKITDVKPEGTEQYINMIYTVSLKLTKDNINNKDFSGDDSHAGVVAASKVTPSTSGGADAVDSIYDDRKEDKGTNEIDDETDQIVPEECQPGGRGDITVANYGHKDFNKSGWDDLIENAKATAGNVEGANTAQNDQADCDASNGVSLSWIICPIIDLGANASDFMFEEVISPLLRNVPITTNESDPAFQAWQQFRLLGNVILVGTLLAIVYSQAKGGK